MKRAVFITTLIGVLTVASAASACTAEYKAQRDNPTQFRHTTMQIPADKCTRSAAASYVRSRLAASGWKLLAIVGVSG